jgi:hypothetical protein
MSVPVGSAGIAASQRSGLLEALLRGTLRSTFRSCACSRTGARSARLRTRQRHNHGRRRLTWCPTLGVTPLRATLLASRLRGPTLLPRAISGRLASAHQTSVRDDQRQLCEQRTERSRTAASRQMQERRGSQSRSPRMRAAHPLRASGTTVRRRPPLARCGTGQTPVRLWHRCDAGPAWRRERGSVAPSSQKSVGIAAPMRSNT